MGASEPTARIVLSLLDPAQGGSTSATVESLRESLKGRNLTVEPGELDEVLDRLVARGEVVRVATEDRGSVFTRPSVLLRMPGVASVLMTPPGRHGPGATGNEEGSPAGPTDRRPRQRSARRRRSA
ncbi:MAG TPA: hypothetical protein VMH49_07280 [Thermoplasmata archaeon]|nr:hypothetical protein [Thermoplasmata archaeon]